MSLMPRTDLESHVRLAAGGAATAASAPSLVTAAGTGDNTKVTGQSIDRFSGNALSDSAILAVAGYAVLTAAKVMTFAAEIQESADNSSWDTAEVLYAATTVVSGTGEKHGVKETAVNLRGRKRYIRFNVTPDLTHTGTDTAIWMAMCVLGGSDILPA